MTTEQEIIDKQERLEIDWPNESGVPSAKALVIKDPAPVALTPMDMIARAVANGASIEMIERLVSLKKDVEADEARKAFVSAMAAFKAVEIKIEKKKHVGFDAKNGGSRTDYFHATLDQVTAAVGPELAKVGLSYRWKTEQLEGGIIQVTCIVRHALGHFEETMLRGSPDQSGNKNNIQAVGSTVSYLSRYTLMSALGLASADMDDDGRGSETELITDGQVAELQAGLDKLKTSAAALCKYLGVASLPAIPAKDFKRAKAEIDSNLAKRGVK